MPSCIILLLAVLKFILKIVSLCAACQECQLFLFMDLISSLLTTPPVCVILLLSLLSGLFMHFTLDEIHKRNRSKDYSVPSELLNHGAKSHFLDLLQFCLLRGDKRAMEEACGSYILTSKCQICQACSVMLVACTLTSTQLTLSFVSLLLEEVENISRDDPAGSLSIEPHETPGPAITEATERPLPSPSQNHTLAV